MNLGFDTNSILSSPSGAATYFLELLPALLSQAGEADQLYVFSADDEDKEPLPFLLRNQKLHGVNAPFGSGRLWRNLKFPAVERLVRDQDLDGRLDVCHSFHPPLMPSLANRRLLTVHEVDTANGDDLSGALRRSLLEAEFVVTTSRGLSTELERRLLHWKPKLDENDLARRFQVVPPAVHERYLEPPKGATVEDLCKRFPFLEEPYLLAAGAASEPRRSVPLLAEAYARAATSEPTLPVLVFVAIEERVEEVAAAVKQFEGLEGRLLVMEEVATEELPALYRGAEFLLHPGLDFTYGSAVLEAAACGIPSVVGTRCGVLEILGSSLLVPGKDEPESWSSAILELHRDENRRATRVAEAKVRARSSWARVAEAHWLLYRS